MPIERHARPMWFLIVAVLLLLWGVMGVVGFMFDIAMTPTTLASMTAYDRHLYTARPFWFLWVYGMGVWTSLIGTVALLARRRWARPVYILSLVTVVIMFGWMFVATDIIAVKGAATAMGFPVVIALLAVVEIWLAGLAIRRGWIG